MSKRFLETEEIQDLVGIEQTKSFFGENDEEENDEEENDEEENDEDGRGRNGGKADA